MEIGSDSGHQQSRGFVLNSDGSVVVVGYTESEGQGGKDWLVAKIDENGNKEWVRIIGGSQNNDFATKVVKIESGGYVIGGATDSGVPGTMNIALIRLNENGGVEWMREIGLSSNT